MSADKRADKHLEVIGPAELYERDKVPSMFLPLALFFLEHLPIAQGAAVLDVACGTGIVARLISEHIGNKGSVVGVDISPDMITVAHKQTPPGAPLTWHIGNVTTMPFLADNTFDWVVCQQGFQFFQDKPAALREMYRVLKPGGRLAMIIWRSVSEESQPYQWAKVEALKKHVSVVDAGEKQRSLVPFYDGSEDDLQMLLSKAGFNAINIHNGFFEMRRGTPEEFITEEDYARLEPLIRTAVVLDIREAMQPFQTKGGTLVPYGFHFAQGYK